MTDNIIELINRVALPELLPTKAQNSLKLFYFISSIKWLGKFDIQTFLPRRRCEKVFIVKALLKIEFLIFTHKVF